MRAARENVGKVGSANSAAVTEASAQADCEFELSRRIFFFFPLSLSRLWRVIVQRKHKSTLHRFSTRSTWFENLKSEVCAFFVCITEFDLSVTATVDTAFHLKWDWPSFQWQLLISLFSRCAGKNYTIEVYAILHISSALLCSRQELWAGMWVGKSQGCSARY